MGVYAEHVIADGLRAELERAQARLAKAEAENAKLREMLRDAREQKPGSTSPGD